MILKADKQERQALATPGDFALASSEVVHLSWEAKRAPVYLAAAPLARFTAPHMDFRQARERARSALARLLLSRFTQEPADGFWCREVQVTHDAYGKPHLAGPQPPYPAVSFSYGMNCLWGALGSPGMALGLDVAEAGEFLLGYPYHRLATAREWAEIGDFVTRDRAEAAALLWAAKEAAVKAMGCGYLGFGPRGVHLVFLGRRAEAVFFQARLDVKPKPGFPGWPDTTLSVTAYRRQGAWLALGLALRAADHRPDYVCKV